MNCDNYGSGFKSDEAGQKKHYRIQREQGEERKDCMKRKIIHISEEKCNGCGACAKACHEGAIGMVNGKAVLLRDDYCDGLGDCLPVCPAGAITFEERDAAAYDEKAVLENKRKKGRKDGEAANLASDGHDPVSQLQQWPVQIKLAPVNAPFLEGAELLVAADCTAYAFAGFHERFMKNRITLIGCPKLDAVDYSEKLAEILCRNDIKSITVVRMEVPCCGGIEYAVKEAVEKNGKSLPVQVAVVSTDGVLKGLSTL